MVFYSLNVLWPQQLEISLGEKTGQVGWLSVSNISHAPYLY
jgi:hypothetical protein